jgi:ParB family transcriptional regulator, chromosome partitioning protein
MTAELEIDGRDIELKQLKPLHTRDINLNTNTGFRKIVASIKSIGLIEPLAVYRENGDDSYVILDGYLRYMACQQLGVQSVPCLIYKDNQAYSFNKNVNRLSAYQEIRMLRKSLETIDEPTIAQTFGVKSIRHRLAPRLASNLHPEVVKTFEGDVIGRMCALELASVLPERQLEILCEMKRIGDYSPAFCRSLIIQTPMAKRTKKKRQRRAWAEDEERKKDMVSRLEHAEKQHDFYSTLYRQYSADLLRMTFYIRKLVTNPRIEAHLKSHHPEILARFNEITTDSST